ncbi:MucR-family transcriptional regulator [Sphingobium lactosutens]|uniref:MucR family transcriptional regulator n=1 Tax=Sphingobium lactosutens TaxID=522773 RepID=UPI0015BB432E|nr:MucR family transcriptional regulator [Sphingobium lactosutens]NWK95896.1 MucR-family transcriptional regulator [Sphingobium lactosutens]
MSDTEKPDYTTLTVQLLSAYVANNLVPSNELAALIQSTRSALIEEKAQVEVEVPEHTPAVSIRKSLASREHVISLIDGRPYKTLKRHLAANGLTPDEYRARFGLPKSYPMVAPGYSEQRRAVAQKIGLGQRGSAAQAAAQTSAPSNKVEAASLSLTAPEKSSTRKNRSKTAAPGADTKTSAAPASKVRTKTPTVEEQVVVAAEAAPKPSRKSGAPKTSAGTSPRTAKTARKEKPAASESTAPAREAKTASRTKAKPATQDKDSAAAPTKPARRKLGISTPKSKPSDQKSDVASIPAEG